MLGYGEEETDDQSKDLSVTLENRDSLYDPESEDYMMNPRKGGLYPSEEALAPYSSEEEEEEKGYGFTFDPEIEDLDLFGPETDGESETDGETDGGTGDGTESGTDDDDDDDFDYDMN